MVIALLIFVLQVSSDGAELCRDLTGIGSIELTAGGFDCKLRTDGELTCVDGEGARLRTTVEMETDDCVERAYLVALGGDLLLVYEFADAESGASSVARVTGRGSVVWTGRVAGFNLSEPLVEGTSVYLATIDFVGRLDAAEGEWVWRQELLQERIDALISPGALRREGDQLVATSSGPHQKECELIFAAADGELLVANCE